MDLSKQVAEVALPFVEGTKAVGLVVGVVYEGHSHAYCYGSLEKEGTETPGEKTLFEIGSITKVFTTTLLADMHLRGEVDLDDPVSKFLPSPVVPLNRGGVDVTLRHLATQTSGLPRLPSNIGLKNMRSGNPYANYGVDDLYKFLSKPRLITAPGGVYGYSNLGMGLLGHVLGLAAGIDFESLVIDRICKPLGMNDTAIDLSEDQRGRLAPGHAGGKKVLNWDFTVLAGCGAFRSTVDDMLIFLNANMYPEKTPLQSAIELAQTIQPREKVSRWKRFRQTYWQSLRSFAFWIFLVVLPFILTASFWIQGNTYLATGLFIFGLANLAAQLVPMFLPQPDMALGWHLATLDESEGRIYWHNGGTGGYRSYTGFAEGQDIGVVLLTNSTAPPDPTGVRLLNSLVIPAAGE